MLGEAPVEPRSSTYRLSADVSLVDGESVDLVLFGAARAPFRVERSGPEITRGARLPNGERLPVFGCEYAIDVPLDASERDTLDIEVFVDNGPVELGLARGTTWVTLLHYPNDVRGSVRLHRRMESASRGR